MHDNWETGSAGGRGLAIVAVALGVCALAVSGIAFLLLASDRAALRAEVQAMEQRVEELGARDEKLTNRLGSAEETLERREAGTAKLAAQVLRSVFTVETDYGFGTGFVAWAEGSSTYILTAAHVVDGTFAGTVTLKRKRSGWQGEIAGVDERNDLALIRMNGRPKGILPLWQEPRTALPRPGDELLLVGSPYGLEGSVTKGIVSRATKKEIQTDAAANPGNSGGPAVDKTGRVVGVLVSGGGQNVNFAVPIGRVCLKLRACR